MALLPDITSLKTYLAITDASKDALLTLIQAQVDAAIKRYCKQNIEFQTLIEYRNGMGAPELATYQRPVVSILNLWLDPGGYFGQGVTPFADTLKLTLGKDYILQVDQPDGTSRSGLVRRLGGGVAGSTIDWWPEWRRGTLTARLPPIWPAGLGNIKIQYTAGYQTIPSDLIEALLLWSAEIYRTRKFAGGFLQSEQLGAYKYQLAPPVLITGMPPLVRLILRRYREFCA